MDRDEAKDEAWSYAHAEDVEHVQRLVGIIYDDFESRTCENCKYFVDTFCTNKELDYVFTEWWKMPENFGCNIGFERKSDGNV